MFLEPDEPQHFLDPTMDVRRRHLGFLVQLEAHIFTHGQGVEQRPFLEDQAHGVAHLQQLGFAHPVDALSQHPDRT